MADENDVRSAADPAQPAGSPPPSPEPAGPPSGTEPAIPGGQAGSTRWDRFSVWTARRPVQLVAVGLAGAIVGGALVGFFESIGHHDGPGRHGFYGRGFGRGPYMRDPGFRMRQWNGVPPWQGGQGPRFMRPSPAPSAVPTATTTVTVTPTPAKS